MCPATFALSAPRLQSLQQGEELEVSPLLSIPVLFLASLTPFLWSSRREEGMEDAGMVEAGGRGVEVWEEASQVAFTLRLWYQLGGGGGRSQAASRWIFCARLTKGAPPLPLLSRQWGPRQVRRSQSLGCLWAERARSPLEGVCLSVCCLQSSTYSLSLSLSLCVYYLCVDRHTIVTHQLTNACGLITWEDERTQTADLCDIACFWGSLTNPYFVCHYGKTQCGYKLQMRL